MTNGKPSPALAVAVVEQTAFIKIPGRANHNLSMDFKRLVAELRQRGFNRFVLDLGQCVTMDSTFLGVLAGLALRNADGKEIAPDGSRLNLELLNPNPRVADLLENLGVAHLFTVLQQATPCTLIFEDVSKNSQASREEMTRNCLEAHEALMKVSPDNIPKFKDVTQFLAEDLRKMKETPPSPQPSEG